MSDARIFQELKADHDRHRDLLERLGAAKGASDDRPALFEELRQELQAHAAAEEESLYSVMLANPELRDEARHSVSEHKEIDDFLGELVELDAGSNAWTDKFKELRHRYLHHIDEEEEEMFPEADKALSAGCEEQIARTFEQRKPEELEAAVERQPGDERQ
ncbi:MAG TPA: hemerythrin domain-containing protein [Novosphingobium sp.]|nr:hemerythrin domain-containing protein [Novosphingobium sp.]